MGTLSLLRVVHSKAAYVGQRTIDGGSGRIFQGSGGSLLRARKHFPVESRYGCGPNPTPNPIV